MHQTHDDIRRLLLDEGWTQEYGGSHIKLTPPWPHKFKLIVAVTTRSRRGALNLRSFVRKMYGAAGKKCPI
jgi:hypothetical protein